MRLLLAHGTPRRNAPAPRLAAEQIDVGPDQLDRGIEARVFSRHAPAGSFDLAALIRELPAEQMPDAIAVAIDGASTSWPTNLAACAGPRLLLVGDSLATPAARQAGNAGARPFRRAQGPESVEGSDHALGRRQAAPLQEPESEAATHNGLAQVLEYARHEQFDRIVLTGSDADADFFLSASGVPVHWFPGLLCPVRDSLAAIVRQERREPFIACPPAHSRRFSNLNLTLAALSRAGFSPGPWGADHAERMEYLGHSEFAVVPAEHGEWSNESFEAIAAGALVLTNPFAAITRFRPGRAPLIACATPEDFSERIRYFRDHPDEAAQIRRATADWFDSHLCEARRRDALESLAFRPGSLPDFAKARIACAASRIDFVQLESALPLVPALDALCGRKATVRATIAGELSSAVVAVAACFPRMQWISSGPADFVVATGDSAEGGARCPQRAQTPGGVLGPAEAGRSASEDLSRAEVVWSGGDVVRNAAVAASDERIAKARELLELGLHDEAMTLARPELHQPFNFADALVICADAALESARWPVWNEFRSVLQKLDAHDPRLRHLETRFLLKRGLHARRLLIAGWQAGERGDFETALQNADSLLALPAKNPPAMLLRATALELLGRDDEAVAAMLEHLRHAPGAAGTWRDHGLLLWKVGRKDEAREALRRANDLDPRDADIAAAHAIANREASIEFTRSPVRDLLITMPETNRRHGTGLLLRRFFPDSSEFVTLRSFTNYGGVEEFGGANLLLSAPHLNDAELATRLKRTLEPWRIRRILCVPFSTSEFRHARLARELTRAPMCTYVMDDQNVIARKVPDEAAHALFEVSDLRLTISPEMQAAYSAKFPFRFGMMPPVATVVDPSARANKWDAGRRTARQPVMLGNVWTNGQLNQVARLISKAGLKVDWFGRESHSDLLKIGLHGQGYVPDDELLARLAEYPYAIIPSGMLDGTEDNEWLTRLSLPSRLVFLLTHSQIPCLVLGSPETAASRFVERLGVGLSATYEPAGFNRAVREMMRPGNRERNIANARRHAPAFVMQDAGEWLWRSTVAGRALPTPFEEVYGLQAAESVTV
ncbi:MAG TPA: glycosyltransferase [Opitutaceae bacterium]|nr:glycosyltransferase [Opitutaceae bacterium]